MTEKQGPETLRRLAVDLRPAAPESAIASLISHAEVWETERAASADLARRLAETQQRLDVIERDFQWWKDNAIRRRKRAAARRAGDATRDPDT